MAKMAWPGSPTGALKANTAKSGAPIRLSAKIRRKRITAILDNSWCSFMRFPMLSRARDQLPDLHHHPYHRCQGYHEPAPTWEANYQAMRRFLPACDSRAHTQTGK